MDQYVRDRPHPALTGTVVDYSGDHEFSTEPLRRRQAPTGGCAMIVELGPPLRLHGAAACGYADHAHHDHAVAVCAKVIMELTDQPYGSREYAGTYRPKVS